MPLYVYSCSTCGNKFERLRTFAERLEPSPCPECNSAAQFALSLSVPSLVGSVKADSGCGDPSGQAGGCGAGCACGLN